MTPRTQTSHQASISLGFTGSLSFAQPPSPSSKTAVILPPGSKLDSGLHWHELYTEYARITKGVMKLTLEDSRGCLQTYYIGKDSGVVEIPRGRRHRLRRGDQGGKWEEWMEGVEFREGGKVEKGVWDDVVEAEEWTGPMDGRKEAFFRNLAGVVGEPRTGKGISGMLEGIWMVLGVFVVFREFDNWPAMLGGRLKGLEWGLSHAALWVAGVIGSLVGLKGEYEEYTPKELRGINGREKVGGKGGKDL